MNSKISIGQATGRAKCFITQKIIPAGETVAWVQFTPASRYPLSLEGLRAVCKGVYEAWPDDPSDSLYDYRYAASSDEMNYGDDGWVVYRAGEDGGDEDDEDGEGMIDDLAFVQTEGLAESLVNALNGRRF